MDRRSGACRGGAVDERDDDEQRRVPADGPSLYAELSADMRYVAWQSIATTLVVGDANGCADVFRREIATGLTEIVSLSSSGAQGDGDSLEPELSADGRFVVFFSYATNLVPGDTNGAPDVFVRDLALGTTGCFSRDPQGGPSNGGNRYPTISHDGASSPGRAAPRTSSPATPTASATSSCATCSWA
jgi:hypothetical protein